MATKKTTALAGIEWAVAARPFPGENISGDNFLVKATDAHVLMAVVDGLGHGSQASIAAQTAISILRKFSSSEVVALVNRCHRALMMSRGAVLTLASVDVKSGDLKWVGVGNVEGMVVRSKESMVPAVEHIKLHGGLVGYQMPILQAGGLTMHEGDLLILATDGIGGDMVSDVRRNDAPKNIAEHILQKQFKGNDDGLVFVARYLGAPHE